MNYSEWLIQWCEKTCQFFGWNFEAEDKAYKETGSRKVYADEQLKIAVKKAILEAEINPGRNIIALYELMNHKYMGWLDYEGPKNVTELTIENIDFYKDYLLHIVSLKETYEKWKHSDLKIALNNFFGNIEIKNDFKFDPSILVAIDKLISSNKFRIYKYVDGEDEIFETDKFYLSNTIGLSSDLSSYLNWVKTNAVIPEKIKDGNVFATLFGCIDPIHPIYSNWILTLHKGQTIWIATDQLKFDNPYQKEARLSRRSVWDERDAVYQSCDLPYEIFHNIEEERKNNKNLSTRIANVFPLPFDLKDEWSMKKNPDFITVKNEIETILHQNNIEHSAMKPLYSGYFNHDVLEEVQIRNEGSLIGYWKKEEERVVIFSGPEIFFKKFDELETGRKVFCLLLIDELLERLKNKGFQPQNITLAKEYIEKKLLKNETFNPVAKETKMGYWDKYNEEIFKEIAETVEDITTPTKALTSQSYALVNNSPEYNANILLTLDQQESLAEWLILNDISNEIKIKINKLASLKKEGEKWLSGFFNENYDEIINRMFKANEINFHYSDYDKIKRFGIRKIKQTGFIKTFTSDKNTVYNYRGAGIGKKDWYNKETCRCCGNSTTKKVKIAHIRFYKELMWLLGLEDRKMLHPYYRQYRTHNFIPYAGNDLLQQTHPYLSIKDPLSKQEPNGMDMWGYSCGYCKNKMAQMSAEKLDVYLKVF